MNDAYLRAILALDGLKRALLFGSEIYEKLKTEKDNRIYFAALERQLEILSEASRRLLKEWLAEFPEINWRGLADVGNVLRHKYRYVLAERIYSYVENEFKLLLIAVETLEKKQSK